MIKIFSSVRGNHRLIQTVTRKPPQYSQKSIDINYYGLFYRLEIYQIYALGDHKSIGVINFNIQS